MREGTRTKKDNIINLASKIKIEKSKTSVQKPTLPFYEHNNEMNN